MSGGAGSPSVNPDTPVSEGLIKIKVSNKLNLNWGVNMRIMKQGKTPAAFGQSHMVERNAAVHLLLLPILPESCTAGKHESWAPTEISLSLSALKGGAGVT